MLNRNLNEEFEIFKRNAADKSISCEIVAGHVVQSVMTGEDGHKLCFLLGTILEDYLMIRKKPDQVLFGPVDFRLNESNIFQPDLAVVEQSEVYRNGVIRASGAEQIPKFIVEVLSDGNEIYDCLDKAVMYGKSGVKEYWLIDLKEEFIYTYSYRNGFDYRRYSFEQNIRSRCYPGFECCISDILWEDGGSLRELALFYRFKKEVYPESAVQLVAEQSSTYGNQSSAEQQYSADAFYEWLSTRKNVQQYTSMVELLMGNIRETLMPAYRYQNIRGNIYFTVKTYLKMKGLPYQMCFAPIAVELKKLDMLDSVVSPDLFLIGSEEMIYDHIYRGVPEWIIEIVTPATASQDYIDKAQLYQYHGVREYWIVNDWKRQVMVVGYLDEKNEEGENVETTVYRFDEKIIVHSLPGLEMIMDEVLE